MNNKPAHAINAKVPASCSVNLALLSEILPHMYDDISAASASEAMYIGKRSDASLCFSSIK